MIRIDAAWLATAPLDMRAGTDTALARVIATFGAAHPHHAYVFANQAASILIIYGSPQQRAKHLGALGCARQGPVDGHGHAGTLTFDTDVGRWR